MLNERFGAETPEHLTKYVGPLPHRFPLPFQPCFLGREAELRRIARALASQSSVWGVLIDGPAGIGKTALAIRAGYQAPDEQFSVKVFLPARLCISALQGDAIQKDWNNYMALLVELGRELGEAEVARHDSSTRWETNLHG